MAFAYKVAPETIDVYIPADVPTWWSVQRSNWEATERTRPFDWRDEGGT
jgi:hypothetical protein